jgi:hypothetical protein
MSDPRYTDPRYPDPRRSGMDQNTPRRADFDEPSSGGSMWTWLAAIVAIIVVLGLAIGYNRTEEARNEQGPPTTTGAAPSAPRPAPSTTGSATPRAAQPAPANPTPANPAPASPAPADGPR